MKCNTIERYGENNRPIFKEKEKFNSLDEAIEIAGKMNLRKGQIRKIISYKCDMCHHYHIGRSKKELTEKDILKIKRRQKRKL